ncbi:hypothetical protein CDAR_105631 [Caerostris darwini]|uniref:Uncharacterized protein n=1 Tax=Caerostris darwini TaxID=1538125 RepID=A0AAV4V016_9ARAC|nr:hypothetical protein CDAR_105631 [Caerostris darwini]
MFKENVPGQIIYNSKNILHLSPKPMLFIYIRQDKNTALSFTPKCQNKNLDSICYLKFCLENNKSNELQSRKVQNRNKFPLLSNKTERDLILFLWGSWDFSAIFPTTKSFPEPLLKNDSVRNAPSSNEIQSFIYAAASHSFEQQ